MYTSADKGITLDINKKGEKAPDIYSSTSQDFKLHISDDLVKLIPPSLVRQYQVIPLDKDGDELIIGIENPYNFIAIEHIERLTGLKIVPKLMDIDHLNHHINRLYGSEPIAEALNDFNKEIQLSESNKEWHITSNYSIADSPIVRIVDALLSKAIKQQASDIHIEPTDTCLRIRFRIDGLLQTITNLPLETHNSIITRIKILGNMNIAEKRLPLDGGAHIVLEEKEIDIRISTIPTIFGEKCLVRLLDREYFLFPRANLGLTEENLNKFNRLLQLNKGIILVCGPTGSGKSTTMYTMLTEMDKEIYNIITIEDPVECKIPGINQIQVNEKSGITFANSLRSVLRQDPDIILVGEIRDNDTAKMAIRAAITGHLVISTIHTYDAIGAITRMLEMGIDAYLLADALEGVVSQRLIRKVCRSCCEGYRPDEYDLSVFKLNFDIRRTWYKAIGCVKCNYTGYKGRTAIHEILNIDKSIRRLINSGALGQQIYNYAIKQNFIPLKSQFIKSLDFGITTLEEALRFWQHIE